MSHISAQNKDPLALAIAQSGIQPSGEESPFVVLDPDYSQSKQSVTPRPIVQLPTLATSIQTACLDRAIAGSGDGGSDSWLKTCYYIVDEEEQQETDDPDDPRADVAQESQRFVSLLPRTVSALRWPGDVPPPYSLEELAALAVCSSAGRRLSIPLMAAYIKKRFPSLQTESSLQDSLVEAVSGSPCFRRPHGAPGRRWTVSEQAERGLAESIRRRVRVYRPSRDLPESARRTGGRAWGGDREEQEDEPEEQLPLTPIWQEDHSYAAKNPVLRAQPPQYQSRITENLTKRRLKTPTKR